MINKVGFDTAKYLQAQIDKILNRVSKFDKLYLEFGGKLRFDYHASRVLPGYAPDTKIQILKKLGGKIEIIHCISSKDIDSRKIRNDFGLTYEDQIIKDINDLNKLGLPPSAVIINRFSGENNALKFKQRLENMGIRVFIGYEIPNYLLDLDHVLSDEGYGKPEWVSTSKKIIIITAPGPGSGKMSFAMSQVYQDRKHGINSGFAKFETFPIWNLELNHPVNTAYEAATADLGDYNVVDPYHLAAYGITAINYNRDVENFAILKRLIEKMVGPDDPLAAYKSPTDMGVNMAKEGILDDNVCKIAAKDEIIRRYFRCQRDFVEGNTPRDTLVRIENIIDKVGVKPEDRSVVEPARWAASDAERRKMQGKGHKGIYCGAAIEVYLDNTPQIVLGENSPLMHAESAAILNAVKKLSRISDNTLLINRQVIESMIQLKRTFGLSTASLDVKEVLDVLAASAVTDENARRCIECLVNLKGCEMHTTHLTNYGDEAPLKQLGINLTTDAKIPLPTF